MSAITDEQRLDWLETSRATVSYADASPGEESGPHVCVYPADVDAARRDHSHFRHFFGATFREAIDKAMQGSAH